MDLLVINIIISARLAQGLCQSNWSDANRLQLEYTCKMGLW